MSNTDEIAKKIEELRDEIERLQKQAIEEAEQDSKQLRIRDTDGKIKHVVESKRVGNTKKGQSPFWIYTVEDD